MKVYITLDYELFFGASGSVEQSIIQPTQYLIKVLDKHKAKAIFFVDIGYLIRCDTLSDQFPALVADANKVKSQIKELAAQGHDIQLHIHSHWEDAYYDKGQWIFPMEHYRLHSYSEEKIHHIFLKYKNYLEKISGKKVFAFRAGGWCIQPFSKLKQAFIDTGIVIDSTVFIGGKNTQGVHYYNFKDAPLLDEWMFSDDPCTIDNAGLFKEIPISSYKVSPLFFLNLLFHKKFGGEQHKQMGDGFAVNNGLLQKLRLLFGKTNTVVSIDGYKSSFLERAYKKYAAKNSDGNFVIIGHPKAFSNYSLNKLDAFLSRNKVEVRTFEG